MKPLAEDSMEQKQPTIQSNIASELEIKNKVGRPQGETNNRDKLINAARELFVEYDYTKVSLREIASKAGTDSGLIRYYFGSKHGLFAAMFQETAEPVLRRLKSIKHQQKKENPAEFMKTYYRVMSAHPHFPRLVFKLANLDPNLAENQELIAVFDNIIDTRSGMIFDNLFDPKLLRDGVDTRSALLSFIAMMVFPFLMPDKMLSKMNIKITPEFLATLAEQNSQLLIHGLFNIEDNNNEEL